MLAASLPGRLRAGGAHVGLEDGKQRACVG
jgi:hypothetical protein